MPEELVLAVGVFLVAVSLLLAHQAYITWKRKEEVPEAALFAILLVCASIYAFGYAGEVVQRSIAPALFWLHIEYIGVSWVPGLWILAVCRHNGIKFPSILPFFIPLLVFFGQLTNWFHLFYSGPALLEHRSPFWVLNIPRGPIYQLHVAYLVGTFLVGAGIYVSGLRNASTLYRQQSILLLASSAAPLLGFFLYLGGASPYGLDLSPIGLGLSAVFIRRALVGAGVFDLVPLARGCVFQGMRDAAMIFDNQGRLLDYNPAAHALLPFLEEHCLGKEIGAFLQEEPQLSKALLAPEKTQEILIGKSPQREHFEVRTFILRSGAKRLGQAAIIANISGQVRMREELRRQAETDPLTGISNRRRFVRGLEQECRQHAERQTAFSLLLIDLDHFKSINDTYGHPTGDAVLCCVAQRLQSCLRPRDLIARFGGEEFAILLPGIGGDQAPAIAERIRACLSESPIKIGIDTIPVTASIGVLSQESYETVYYNELLKQVDESLYKAKERGRNRIAVV